MNDDIDSYLIAMETSEVAGPSATRCPSPDRPVKTPIPIPANNRARLDSEEEEQEEDADQIERPPNKKVRSI